MCGMMINGIAHGGRRGTTVCQLHMRHFKDGDEIYLEPWRARAFPLIRDLAVDRSAFDRIIAAGGFVSVPTGSAPDGNAIPIPKEDADLAMDAAACIGCGACVAACPKPPPRCLRLQGVAVRAASSGPARALDRVRAMVAQPGAEGFGGCTNVGECEAVCPKQIGWSSSLA
jgi:succinate dehydrogenase / fumarate reductase iron-sulfur subunit